MDTTLERQLDLQGLLGFGFVCFLLFLGAWFLDGFGNGFFVISGWILASFWLPESMKNGIEIGIDF